MSHGFPPLDERFYPSTDECDWEPLRLYLGNDELLGDWMFMCADIEGCRYYKHSCTRESVILDGDVA